MKTLVIAEKPSVGRDIARVLGCQKKENGYLEGPSYVVTWALGHLVTLQDPEDYDKKYKEWKLEDLPMMPERLKTKVIPQTGKQYRIVAGQLERKDISRVVIATDAGSWTKHIAGSRCHGCGSLRSRTVRSGKGSLT